MRRALHPGRAVARAAVAAAIVLVTVPPASAVDGVSLELAESVSSLTDITAARIGMQWNWDRRLLETKGWYLGGYWNATAGYWQNSSDPAIRTSSSVYELGFTPTLRWQQIERTPLGPFIDLGVGVRYVSEDSLTTLRDLSGHLQFGSVLGVGLRAGPRSAYEFSYRVEHLSNGGTRAPNNGINFQSIRFQYRL